LLFDVRSLDLEREFRDGSGRFFGDDSFVFSMPLCLFPLPAFSFFGAYLRFDFGANAGFEFSPFANCGFSSLSLFSFSL